MKETRLGSPPPPKRLESNLRSYRSRMRWTKLTERFAMALSALVVSFLLVAALDRFVDTSGVVRAALFGASLAVSVLVVPRALNRWFFRHRSLREVAREVTLRNAAVGDRFLGVFELSHDRKEFERSPELVTAAIAQGERDLGDLDLGPLLPPSRHGRALGILAVPAAAAAVFAVTLPAVAGNSFQRWVKPFGDTERYTFARLDGLENAWVMPIQEIGSQSLALASDTERQPSEAVLHLRGGTISAPLLGGRYALELPPLAEDQTALLVVGDMRETIRLEPRERPELVAANAAVVLPSYLGIKEPLDRDVRGGSLTVVEGAELSVSLVATRSLRSATAMATDTLEGGDVSDVQADLPAAAKVAVQWAGRSITLPSEPAGTGRKLLVSWVDELGLEGHRPFQLGVRTRVDEAPVVALSGADAETVLLESVPLTFDVLTSDDFGVRRIGLEWRTVGRFGRIASEILGEKVLLAGGAADDTLEAFATFQPQTLGVESGTYEIRGWAEDAMPGRPRALSTPIRVRVMTPSEHMDWVTANLDRWMQRAVEVRDREMELLAENKAIYALPQGELDMPETRARIENQARAERANRARLQGLVSQGQELLAEAARNDEFGSNSLDDWAEANAAMKDIADTRMNSVANRLQEAARAESSAEAKAADGSPKNPATQGGPPKPSGSSGQQPKDSGGEKSDAKMAAGEPTPGGDSKSKKKDPKIIGEDRGEAGGAATKPKEGEEEENPEDEIPPTPTIQDGESTMGKAEPGAPKEAQKGPAPKASLGLVETTLGPAPDDGSEAPKDEAEEPAEEPVSKTRSEIAAAIAEQEALLEAFNKVAGDIEDVLVALENSTFVKRLKAASRAQNDSSEDLDVSVASGFGNTVATSTDEIKEATAAVAGRRDVELPKLTHLHSDMDAYADRLASRSSEDSAKFQRVLEEWNQLRPTLLADVMVEEAEGGRPGDARASADFLSDTLDRWGEELVGPG